MQVLKTLETFVFLNPAQVEIVVAATLRLSISTLAATIACATIRSAIEQVFSSSLPLLRALLMLLLRMLVLMMSIAFS